MFHFYLHGRHTQRRVSVHNLAPSLSLSLPPSLPPSSLPPAMSSPYSCVQLLVLSIRAAYLDVNKKTAQLQLLVELVPERNGTEPGPQRGHGERGLSDEVGVAKHILVLRHEPDQSQLRVEDFKLAALVPDRVEPIVLCGGGVCVCVCARACEECFSSEASPISCLNCATFGISSIYMYIYRWC